MLFNSPVYIFLFLPVVAVGYYRLARCESDLPRKAWLVAASLFFYGYWKPIYLIVLFASVSVNYGLVAWMKKGASRHRFVAMAAGVVFNLGLLGYYKYAGFFVENLNDFAGTQFPPVELALPLAISFFTFQQIAYVVDSYYGKAGRHSLIDYVLFVTFFPQLIAGPIVHHREMMPQFQDRDSGRVQWNHILAGAFVFAVGLFKKVAVADTFAVHADAGFNAAGSLGMLEAWAACLSYTFQIYFDFSGYTDMAIGAALLLNIRLPANFNSPYKALTIQDFWRRWHMTLSRWLRDYVYIPLGGNRRGPARTYLAILSTFILGGFWHGAGWTFVIWGALHGLAVAGHRVWSQAGLRLPAPVAWPLTFGFVCVTWVFFRAANLDTAFAMIADMTDLSTFAPSATFRDQWAALLPGLVAPAPAGAPTGTVLSEWVLVWAAAAMVVTATAKNSMALMERYLVPGATVHWLAYLLLALTAATGITCLFASSSNVFLYFNF